MYDALDGEEDRCAMPLDLGAREGHGIRQLEPRRRFMHKRRPVRRRCVTMGAG